MNNQTEYSTQSYENLEYSQSDLAAAMRETYDELIDFVTRPAFLATMDEMSILPNAKRPGFVVSVLLDTDERSRRGIEPPEGVLIQRSAFGDRRPTLFCVKKFLPERFANVWQNVNLTFDNEFLDQSVSRDRSVAWRPPMDVAEQALLMAQGAALDERAVEPISE